jgi:hypothetical protein
MDGFRSKQHEDSSNVARIFPLRPEISCGCRHDVFSSIGGCRLKVGKSARRDIPGDADLEGPGLTVWRKQLPVRFHAGGNKARFGLKNTLLFGTRLVLPPEREIPARSVSRPVGSHHRVGLGLGLFGVLTRTAELLRCACVSGRLG